MLRLLPDLPSATIVSSTRTLSVPVAVTPRSPIGYNRLVIFDSLELRLLPDLPSATIRTRQFVWVQSGPLSLRLLPDLPSATILSMIDM